MADPSRKPLSLRTGAKPTLSSKYNPKSSPLKNVFLCFFSPTFEKKNTVELTFFDIEKNLDLDLDVSQQRRLESSSAAASTSAASSSPSATPSALASFLARAKSRGGLISAPSPSYSPSSLLSSSLLSSLSSSSSSSSPEGLASKQRVLRLRAEAVWSRWGRVAGLAAGATGALLLWKGVRAVSEKKGERGKAPSSSSPPPSLATDAKAAAASLAAVAVVLALARRRLSASPRQVHAAALRRLAQSPAVVEVLGPPLVSPPASATRVAVESGGGVSFRSLAAAERSRKRLVLPSVLPRPAWRPRRVQAVFAVEGSQRRALASVDARKRGGELVFRVLALDVPVAPEKAGGSPPSSSPSAPAAAAGKVTHRRIFLEGDESGFARGGVLAALRSALVNASAARGAFDAADDVDAAAEEARQAALLRAADAVKLAEAERRLRRAVVVEGGEEEGAGVGGESEKKRAEAATTAVDVSSSSSSPSLQPWWRRLLIGMPLIV